MWQGRSEAEGMGWIYLGIGFETGRHSQRGEIFITPFVVHDTTLGTTDMREGCSDAGCRTACVTGVVGSAMTGL